MPVTIASLIIQERNSDGFNEIFASASFQDPAGIENYYRLAALAEMDGPGNYIIDDDRLQDGGTIIIATPVSPPNGKLKRDSITVMLQSIDRTAYEYLRTVHELQQEGFRGAPASPANPASNFSSGALGYFSAYSETAKSIAIPK